uniref:Telomeric single stranded DNA binding POT1/Cdc13 domain-containing protein n=1 Tax=Ditylenchus dipsaci TaxID=166011 RepID=A0A915CXM9_9BILA
MMFEKDHIYMAWITYKKHSTNTAFRRQIAKINAEWVVQSQPIISILQSELNAFLQANSLNGMQSVSGVVVSKDNETGTGSIYNPKHGVCDYQLTSKTAFNVGSFVHFIPMEDLFGCMTALNIFKTSSLAHSVSLLSTKPDIKLSISNWNYNDQRNVVCAPDWGLTFNFISVSFKDLLDYSQPLAVVYDKKAKKFTLPDEDDLNLYSSLSLGSQPVNENKSGPLKKDAETTKVVVPKQNHRQTSQVVSNDNKTSETDAVVVLLRSNNIVLFALRTDLPAKKFTMAKSRFEVEPYVGDWFRISLPTCEIVRKVNEPVLKTVPISKELIKLHTRMKVLDDFVEGNELCGHSDHLGPIIDNAKILKKYQLGKTIDVWVLSTAEINGAHWRIFSEKSKPQRQSDLRPSCGLNARQQKTEDLKDISKGAPKTENTSHTPIINQQRAGKKSKSELLEVVAKDDKVSRANNIFSMRTSGISTAQSSLLSYSLSPGGVITVTPKTLTNGMPCQKVKNTKESAHNSACNAESNSPSIISDKNKTIKANAVVTKLTNPCINRSISKFGENKIPCMGDWFHLTMSSEKDYRNMTGIPLQEPVLKSRIKTKVKITTLPKMASMNSSICGYSEDLGPIVDNSDWLRPDQIDKVIDLWVQHCKPRHGSSWCILNRRLYRLYQTKQS